MFQSSENIERSVNAGERELTIVNVKSDTYLRCKCTVIV